MPALLLLVIILSILAQVLISQKEYLPGAILYVLGAIGLIIWSRKNTKWLHVLTKQVQIPSRIEIWIGLLLLVVIIFTRFYDLGYRVYGLEADETKWTVQSWLSTILKVDAGEFASMHYQFLPVDFWVRSIFLRLFGLDFLSARIESAVFSVVAAVFLFLLIRRLTSSPPTALLGTALYAFSFIELNGSHQALHNTTLEPWMMAGLYFVVSGLQDKKWWQFQVAGIILALGMLTYETFFPTVGVAILFSFGMAIYQIARKQANPKQWLQHLVFLIWPVILIYLVYTQPYLASRHGYHFGWLDAYSEKGTNLVGAATFVIQNFGVLLKTTFSEIVFPDSLLRWQGSFLNQLLLPFVVIGFICNLCILRKPLSAFIPLWYLINVAFAPLALGSVWPRVLYTSLAPLMIWGAMGLWVFLAALRQWLHRLKINIPIPIFIGLLLIIFVNDYHIFTNGIDDPLDRLKRRELADMTAQVAEDTDFLVFPFMPAQNDTFELETHVLLFTIASAHKTGLEAQNDFTQIPYDQLMTFLWQNRQGSDLVLFNDRSNLTSIEERSSSLDLLLTCYPDTTLQLRGDYFDVYRIDAGTLAHPVCYQGSAPSAVYPTEGMEIPTKPVIAFVWDSGEIATTGYTFILEQNTPDTYWIEAEDQFQTNGWYAASEFTTGFTGTSFLLDNWDSGEAQYTLNIENENQYRIWVRSYKRQYNDQQNFITLNNQPFFFSGNDSLLDQWTWESIGILDLAAGETTIGLGRLYGQDDMFSVFIDAVLITADLESSPGESNIWKTVYSIEDIDDPRSQFSLAEPLPPGKYRWSVRVFDGDQLVDSDGQLGISMPYSSFTILP